VNIQDNITTLSELGAAFVADGMQKLGLSPRIADPSLHPLLLNERIAGTVVTKLLEFRKRKQPPVAYIYTKAFEQAKMVARPVLVTESRLGRRSPYGGRACRALVHAGLTGVIVDGAIRDTADVKAQGMQIFYRLISPDSYVVPRLPEGYVGGDACVEVCAGGVMVCPGDLVIADEDGIVFCRSEDATAVIAAAREIRAEEEALFERWDAGQGFLEAQGLAPTQPH
jgi:4-hydroxy-4-methyl-2-oxoglutarate aldolase|tara:strand:- start:4178 stop:4855 length:678 start_codon:yes stop_codon:yes gene_type:complete